jgi:hypothetical protein
MTAIVLLKPWKIWPIGHVIPEMPPAQARLLVGRGIAREKDDKKPAFAALVDRSVRANQMQLKGRR